MKKLPLLILTMTAMLGVIATSSFASTYQLRVASQGVKGERAGPAWTECAVEGGACQFSGTLPVRYGANGTYVTMAFTGVAGCNNATFGDPTPEIAKTCSYDAAGVTPVAWTNCAAEGNTCRFSGTRLVQYGAKGTYVTKTATGSIECSTAAFGTDPVYNVPKACYFSSGVQ